MDMKEVRSATEEVAQYLAEEGAARQIGQIADATGLKWTEARSALGRMQYAGRVTSEGHGLAQRWSLAPTRVVTADDHAGNFVPADDRVGPDSVRQCSEATTAVAPESPEAVDAESSRLAPPADTTVSTAFTDPAIGYVWLLLGEVEEATVEDLHDRTGYGHQQTLQALWALWEAGLASSTGRLRPDRGRWHRVADADASRVVEVSLTDVPAKVACFACGHVQALRYRPGQAKAVALYDPSGPVPTELTERDVPVRAPQVLFCAEILDRSEAAASALVERTGFAQPVIVRALWALHRHGLVHCTDPHGYDGGTWSGANELAARAAYVSLADAPSAIGCHECGRSVPLGSNASGKAKRGVSRVNTGDGGTPLPHRSLNAMVKAWAMAAGEFPATAPTVGATELFELLCRVSDTGELAAWLTVWAKTFDADPDAARVPAVLAALDAGDRPRSSGSVLTALRRLSLENPPPVTRVRDAAVETYRPTTGYGSREGAAA